MKNKRSFLVGIMFVLNVMCCAVAGPTVSILGDNYSAYDGCMGKSCYPHASWNITQVSDMWWSQVLSQMDGSLEKQASWSESLISGASSFSSFLNRSRFLGNPEVILVMGGANDGSVAEDTFRADLNTLVTSLERNYPKSKKFYLAVPTVGTSGFAAAKRTIFTEVVNARGYPLVDLADCGMASGDLLYGNPKKSGMTKIAAVAGPAICKILEDGYVFPGEGSNVAYAGGLYETTDPSHTLVTVGSERIVTFTNCASEIKFTPRQDLVVSRMLLVGGGGAGGWARGKGGAGGAVRDLTGSWTLRAGQTYRLRVGGGGFEPSKSSQLSNSKSYGMYTSMCWYAGPSGLATEIILGDETLVASGGQGGASGWGTYVSPDGANGGAATTSDITGADVAYAAGGVAAGDSYHSLGASAADGFGRGGNGGGTGDGNTIYSGGSGGSGCVILRFTASGSAPDVPDVPDVPDDPEEPVDDPDDDTVTVTVIGDPSDIGQPNPAYGAKTCTSGTSIPFSAPGATPVSDDGRTIRKATGYEIRDKDGNKIGGCEGGAFQYAPEADCTVVWLMHEVDYRLDIESSSGGKVVTNVVGTADSVWQRNGSAVEITAVAATGYVFDGWTGEVAEADKGKSTLALTMTAPMRIRATFRSEGGGTVTDQLKVSILGDSYSAYAGGMGENYYPHTSYGISQVSDMWWHQILSQMDGILEVQAAWSGSRMSGNTTFNSFVNRSRFLGNPDVIFVMGGLNDEWNSVNNDTFRADLNTLVTSLERNYPKAKKFFFAVPSICNFTVKRPILIDVVQSRGYPLVDLENCGLLSGHLVAMHPTKTGMTKFAETAGPAVCKILEDGYVFPGERPNAAYAGGLYETTDPSHTLATVGSDRVLTFTNCACEIKFTPRQDLVVSRMLLVGGGGAGGWAEGKGGAGGAVRDLTGSWTLRAGQTYRLRVGSGGFEPSLSSQMSNSKFAGMNTSMWFHAGPSGTASEIVLDDETLIASGGQGGASGYGTYASPDGANGGEATTSDITGADVAYAAGGAKGGKTGTKGAAVADGLGLGGNGGNSNGMTGYGGGNGGSGCVILRFTTGGSTPDVPVDPGEPAEDEVRLTVVGDPSDIGQPSPAYGARNVVRGTSIPFAAPSATPVADDGRTIRKATGYEIRDTGGNKIGGGDGSSFQYAPEADCTVVWMMHEVDYRLDVESSVGGAVVTNAIGVADSPWQLAGTSVEIVATPAAGYVFTGWTGDVAEDSRSAPTLSFAMNAPARVRATFAVEGADPEPADADLHVETSVEGADCLAFSFSITQLAAGSKSADVYLAYGAVGSLGEYEKVKSGFRPGAAAVARRTGVSGLVAYSFKLVDDKGRVSVTDGQVDMTGATADILTADGNYEKTTVNGEYVYVFKEPGTVNVTLVQRARLRRILLAGGGGQGGRVLGGGGGGGALVEASGSDLGSWADPLEIGSTAVLTVGAGGNNRSDAAADGKVTSATGKNLRGAAGSQSSLLLTDGPAEFVAAGGGGGGSTMLNSSDKAPLAGACGGGAACLGAADGGVGSVGKDGGRATWGGGSLVAPGGGGGMKTAGANGLGQSQSGAGGEGIESDITGENVVYCSGGGGGGGNGALPGAGGTNGGVGGTGGVKSNFTGDGTGGAGVDGTGSGGGGGGCQGYNGTSVIGYVGGKGGDGAVILRFAKIASQIQANVWVSATNDTSATIRVDLLDAVTASNAVKVYLAYAKEGEVLPEPALVQSLLTLDRLGETSVDNLEPTTPYVYRVRLESPDGSIARTFEGSFTTCEKKSEKKGLVIFLGWRK